MFLKILLFYYICLSIAQTINEKQQPIGEEYIMSTSFDLLDDIAKNSKNISENDLKNILRYGFHKTEECRDFKLVYICIRKCLDLNYDVAHADKKCQCRCFKKPGKDPQKDKMTIKTTADLWKEGPPSTKLPYWILNLEKLAHGNDSTPGPDSDSDDNDVSQSPNGNNTMDDNTVTVDTADTVAGNGSATLSDVSAGGNDTSVEPATGAAGNSTEGESTGETGETGDTAATDSTSAGT